MLNLKQKLEPMRLTAEQKKRIKTNAKKQQPKPQSFMPFVFSTFILLTGFFVLISISDNNFSLLGEKTTAAGPSIQKARWTKNIVLWNSANTIFIFLSIHYFKKCLKETLRWQRHETMQEWHAFFSKSARVQMLLVITVAILWFSVYCIPNIWLVQVIFVILTVTVFTLTVLYDVRDRYWSTCPHCHVEFTRMQIQEKSFNPFREKCDNCNKPIYVNAKENQRKIILYLTPLLPWSLETLFGLPFILVILLIVLSILSLGYFYYPYMIQFSDKDTSVEDLKNFNK